MAAHILSKNQKAACLTKAVENSKKVKLKNVLCGEKHSWPKPSRDVEDKILLKLSEIFRGLPNIFNPVKNLSKVDQDAKRRVRAQLDLGINCVSRSLEQGRLACVLISGKATPAAAVEHVITVARERGCPLLCLDSLNTTLAKATKSKSFPMCIGFKKLMVAAKSDFVDLISLVQQNTTVHKKFLSIKKLSDIKKNVKKSSIPESLRPIRLDAGTDEAVREDLKRIFTNASFKEAENKMMTNRNRKKKKTKKKLKQYYRKGLHNQFDTGKKTVTEYVGRGKMRLVLIIPELIPVLLAENETSSLLCVARDQDCPILCVSNLSMVICADTAKALAVLGIKKESCLPMNTESSFTPVIEKCLDFMRTATVPVQDMDVLETEMYRSKEITMGEDEDEEETSDKEEEKDYSFLYVLKKDSTDLKEKAVKLKEEQDKATKQLTFTSDFISFGGQDSATTESTVLGKRKSEKPLIAAARLKPKKMLLEKKEQGAAKIGTTSSIFSVTSQNKSKTQPQANVSGDTLGFISFGNTSEKHDTVEEMSTDQSESIDAENHGKENSSILGSDVTEVSGRERTDNSSLSSSLFSISRSGDQKSIVTETGKETLSTSATNVLGLDETITSVDKEAEHAANVLSATARKGKNEDKKRHGQEGFVSFAYTEANIHTMVANSDRTKKKKKGKK